MTVDPIFLIVAVTGVLIAGISKAGFGGGASFVAAPMLAALMEPGRALAVMLPLLIVMDVLSLRAYWGRWSRRDTLHLLAGALPGVALAAIVYRATDPDIFRLLIGAISVGFVAFRIATARGWLVTARRPLPRAAGWASGSVAGFTSFVAHAGGPAALIYLLSQGLTKLQFQATTVAVFAVLNAVKVGIFGGLGLFNTDTLRLAAMLAPVALLGAWLGIHAHRRVPDRAFFVLSYGLLAAAGLNLIRQGLT